MAKLGSKDINKLKKDKDIKALVSHLKHAMPSVRIASAKALCTLKEKKSIKALSAGLSDPELEVVKVFVNCLGKLGAKEAQAALLKLHKKNPKSDEWELQWELLYALGKLKTPEALDLIVKSTKSEHDSIRSVAVRALAPFRNKQPIDVLLACLNDSYPAVRSYAANALSSLTVAGDIPTKPIIKALKDEHEGVRLGALRVLEKRRDPAAIDAIAKLLNDENIVIRKLTRKLLAAFESPEAVKHLDAAAKEEPNPKANMQAFYDLIDD